ncbi:ATP synthase gamma chain, partial [Musa troglodytarum]
CLAPTSPQCGLPQRRATSTTSPRAPTSPPPDSFGRARARAGLVALPAAFGLRELRDRIGSVKNTQKITEAMKLVSAAKVRHAQEAVVSGRPFSESLVEVLYNINEQLQSEDVDVPLTRVHPVRKIALVVVTADRGLCAGFNNIIIKKAEQCIRASGSSPPWASTTPSSAWGRRVTATSSAEHPRRPLPRGRQPAHHKGGPGHRRRRLLPLRQRGRRQGGAPLHQVRLPRQVRPRHPHPPPALSQGRDLRRQRRLRRRRRGRALPSHHQGREADCGAGDGAHPDACLLPHPSVRAGPGADPGRAAAAGVAGERARREDDLYEQRHRQRRGAEEDALHRLQPGAAGQDHR